MRLKLSGILSIAIILSLILLSYNLLSCNSAKIPPVYPTDTLATHQQLNGMKIEISFERGTKHNHPLMAVWITDTSNNYFQTVYVAESIAKGVFEHGKKREGKWIPGELRRPAALPVWAHQRNVLEADGLYIPTKETAMPDAFTGATPQNNFTLYSATESKMQDPFKVWFEINQPWDWNEYWTNNKYPNDEEYKTSCQPSLIYCAIINPVQVNKTIRIELIGHGHYNGSSGEISTDLSTITTAKDITKNISIKIY
jgi:hypothetical protein